MDWRSSDSQMELNLHWTGQLDIDWEEILNLFIISKTWNEVRQRKEFCPTPFLKGRFTVFSHVLTIESNFKTGKNIFTEELVQILMHKLLWPGQVAQTLKKSNMDTTGACFSMISRSSTIYHITNMLKKNIWITDKKNEVFVHWIVHPDTLKVYRGKRDIEVGAIVHRWWILDM